MLRFYVLAALGAYWCCLALARLVLGRRWRTPHHHAGAVLLWLPTLALLHYWN